MKHPDRHIPRIASVIRHLVRRVRLLRLRLIGVGKIEVGNNFAIGCRATIISPDYFRVGDNVRIGASFQCETNVEMGGDILISSNVSIVGNDHAFDDSERTVYNSRRLPATLVVIEGDNLIGNGVIIVGPARIGRGAIVGAGAVVTGDLQPSKVYARVPARF